jgi:hypothetical protein
MGKGLAIAGILGAVGATLAMLVLVGAAAFLVLPIILAGSVALLAQRTAAGAVAGLLLLALAVVAALGLAGSVTTEDGTTDFGFDESSGRLLAVAGCLAIPLAAIGVRWSAIEPQALAYVGLFCAAVAFLLAAARPDRLVDQSDAVTLASGLLPLGAVASMVGLWRGSGRADDAAGGTLPAGDGRPRP